MFPLRPISAHQNHSKWKEEEKKDEKKKAIGYYLPFDILIWFYLERCRWLLEINFEI